MGRVIIKDQNHWNDIKKRKSHINDDREPKNWKLRISDEKPNNPKSTLKRSADRNKSRDKLYEHVTNEENPLSVRVTSSKYATTNSHWHEHLEMKYFLGGVTRSVIGDKDYMAFTGDILLVNPCEIHSFTTAGDIDNIVIMIDPSFYSDIDMNNIIFEHFIKNDNFLQTNIKKMYDLSNQNDINAKFKIKAIANNIMERLVSKYIYGRLTSEEAKSRAVLYKKISETLEYIENNYRRDIQISDLLNVLHYSEGYFTRIFKEATGKTPIKYINEYRVIKASGLLHTTDWSITEVSSYVGFNDVNYFTRLFRRFFSMTPSEYRKSEDIIDFN